MRAVVRLVVLFSAIGAIGLNTAGCRNGRSAAAPGAAAVVPAGPVVVLHAGERTFPIRVEVAATDAARERGLMYRNHLDADAGMLFIFDRDAPLTFWMKNTFIRLDMIFIGSDRHVVGIVEDALPETETPRRVAGESRYVLEIGGGLSRRLGIIPGSTVEFQSLPREALSN